jgi:uncharacterized protein YyaL (SSP411 family)
VGRAGDGDFMLGADFYTLSAAQREQVHAPGIDQHAYANYNALSIAALGALYEATFDPSALEAATRAYTAIERDNRRGAAYTHAAHDTDPLTYFTDNAEMARALFALHQVTGDARYVLRLHELVRYTIDTFEDREHGGFFAHTPDPEAVGALAVVPKSATDNARFARLLLWLSRLDSDEALHATAERTLLAAGGKDALREQGRDIGDYLLATEDLLSDYAIITIVGDAADDRTQALQHAGLAAYAPNRMVTLVSPDASHYPYPGAPVAYLCTSDSCSMPIQDPSAIEKQLRAAVAKAGD